MIAAVATQSWILTHGIITFYEMENIFLCTYYQYHTLDYQDT